MAKILKPGELPKNTKSPWILHGSQLVVIDIEFTNLDPVLGEIFQLAMIALDYEYQPLKDFPKLCMFMKVNCLENVDWTGIAQASYNKEKFMRIQQAGVDPEHAVDLLLKWVAQLELSPFRRLCPLAANWTNDRPYIQSWLGNQLFENLFHPHYRDLIPAMQFVNDSLYWQGKDPEVRNCGLNTLANFFQVENPAHHDALNDCIVTAEVYRKMLQRYGAYMGGL